MVTNQWYYVLDVSDVFYHGDDDGEILFAAARAVAKKVEQWQNAMFPLSGELEELADELVDAASAEDIEWFNQVWDALYDWADANRVWIKTFE